MSCDFEDIGSGLSSPGRASEVQMNAGLAGPAARMGREIAEADSGEATGANARNSETAGACGAHGHELGNGRRAHRSRSLPGSSSSAATNTIGRPLVTLYDHVAY